MCGLTIATMSIKCLLQSTGPEGNAITLVPSSEILLSYFVFFVGGKSLWLLNTMGSGTGMFKSWCTSAKSLFLNCVVSSISFSLTIVSGKPFSTRSSAFDLRDSLYSWTCYTKNIFKNVFLLHGTLLLTPWHIFHF